MATANRFSRLFAIAKKNGIDKETIDELCRNVYAKGSLKELTPVELTELERSVKTSKSSAEVMRRKVIYILATMEEYKSSVRHYEFIQQNNQKPKMYGDNGIYEFVKSVGYLKKDFNSYTTEELPKLVTQIKQLQKNTWNSEANRAVKQLLT